MSEKKVRDITIKESEGVFSMIKGAFSTQNTSYDFSGISALRKLLSKERARMLDVIKTQKPNSIYDLSKKLNRSFKSVFEDIKLFERFGLVDLVSEKSKGRKRHKPVLITDTLTIHLKI